MLKHMHIAVLAVAAATATASQTGATVPSSLLIAASQSPVDFAFALANASVPSGLEIRESDNVSPSPSPVVIDPKARVALHEVVTAFNAPHRDYRAVLMRDGVTVIRPIKGTLPFLDEPSPLSQVTVIGVMAAVRNVFAALDPALTGPALNSLGRKGDDVPVVLDGTRGRTVIDTLNQIVMQAPGSVWLVTTREEQDAVRVCRFGLIEAGGMRRTQGMRRNGE